LASVLLRKAHYGHARTVSEPRLGAHRRPPGPAGFPGKSGILRVVGSPSVCLSGSAAGRLRQGGKPIGPDLAGDVAVEPVTVRLRGIAGTGDPLARRCRSDLRLQ
tara:strand:+ start:2321 stop:2635 length:315 start_codon:yes stop_codon:yes gene_type:complete